MHRQKLSIQAVLLAIVALCIAVSPTFETNAPVELRPSNENGSLKVIISINPNVPRRGGATTITVRTQKDQGVVSGATVRTLLTFSDGRQSSISGVSDTNGIIAFTIKIPIGTSIGPVRVDVMIRTESAVAIASSSFTVK